MHMAEDWTPKAVSTIVKLVITTATNHHPPNHCNSKVIKQALVTNQHAIRGQRGALTQSNQVAGKNIKVANQFILINQASCSTDNTVLALCLLWFRPWSCLVGQFGAWLLWAWRHARIRGNQSKDPSSTERKDCSRRIADICPAFWWSVRRHPLLSGLDARFRRAAHYCCRIN